MLSPPPVLLRDREGGGGYCLDIKYPPKFAPAAGSDHKAMSASWGDLQDE